MPCTHATQVAGLPSPACCSDETQVERCVSWLQRFDGACSAALWTVRQCMLLRQREMPSVAHNQQCTGALNTSRTPYRRMQEDAVAEHAQAAKEAARKTLNACIDDGDGDPMPVRICQARKAFTLIGMPQPGRLASSFHVCVPKPCSLTRGVSAAHMSKVCTHVHIVNAHS
jgi:hypothetical protein